MSEVGLTIDRHPFRAVSLLLFLLLSLHASETWHLYTSMIPEVMWYEPLYNNNLKNIEHKVLNKYQ